MPAVLTAHRRTRAGKALAEALVNIPSQPTVVAVGRREERLKALEQASGGKIKGLVCVSSTPRCARIKRLAQGRRRRREEGRSVRPEVVEGVSSGAWVDLECLLARLTLRAAQTDAIIINAGIQNGQDWFQPESVDLKGARRLFFFLCLVPALMVYDSARPGMGAELHERAAHIEAHTDALQEAEQGRTGTLRRVAAATLMMPEQVTVTSGLAALPNANVANYCATSARSFPIVRPLIEDYCVCRGCSPLAHPQPPLRVPGHDHQDSRDCPSVSAVRLLGLRAHPALL